jgi:hypothetical protein
MVENSFNGRYSAMMAASGGRFCGEEPKLPLEFPTFLALQFDGRSVCIQHRGAVVSKGVSMTSRLRQCKKAISVESTRLQSCGLKQIIAECASVDPFLLSFSVVCYGFFKALLRLRSMWCERERAPAFSAGALKVDSGEHCCSSFAVGTP